MQLTFGAVLHVDDPSTRLLLAEFCAAWSARAEVSIRPHRAPSPNALAAALQRGRLQLMWASPGLYVLSEAFANTHPLVAAVRDGGTHYAGTLFVARQSRFRTVSDLRGTRIAWGPRSSASGHLMPRLALAAAGMDAETFFGSELCLDRHGDVAAAVASGVADVGATFAVFEDGGAVKRAGFEPNHARVLLVSKPIPSDLIVASADVPVFIRERLIASLRELAAHPDLTEVCSSLFGVDGYAAYHPSAYESLARDVEQARAKGTWPRADLGRPRWVG